MKVDGYGSVQKLEKNKPNNKCRKWQLVIPMGINPKTGKYWSRRKNFAGTISEAKIELMKFSEEISSDAPIEHKKSFTLEELGNEFIAEREMSKAKNTIDKYHTHVNAVCRHIGKLPANKCTPHHFLDAFQAMRDGETFTGSPASLTYLNCVHITWNQIFNWAQKRGYVSRNIMKDVARPKIDTKRKRAITNAEVDNLLTLCSPYNNKHVWITLAVNQGLRLREVPLTNWEHVDFLNDTILIPGTKTEGSYRLLPLMEWEKKYLLDWKECQKWMLRSNGLEQTDKTPVVADEFGHVISGDAYGHWWKKNNKHFGIEDITFHGLRHGFATQLARMGVSPRAIADLMGHSDTRMAQDIYVHNNVDDLANAIGKIDRSYHDNFVGSF